MKTTYQSLVDSVNKFFGERGYIEKELSAEAMVQLAASKDVLTHNGGIINKCIAGAYTAFDSDESKKYLDHANKGLLQTVTETWGPLVGLSVGDEKTAQHFTYKLKQDEITDLVFEAYVMTFDIGRIAVLSSGIIFSQSSTRDTYVAYVPMIVLLALHNDDEDMLEYNRKRLDALQKDLDDKDLIGSLTAIEKIMLTKRYS